MVDHGDAEPISPFGSPAGSRRVTGQDRAEGGDALFLRTLGDRLRLIRAQRGMSRRALAERSGVSERYIAQFEAGAGNMSLLLLRRLAHALGVPAEALAAERPDRALDLVLLEQFLARLDEAQLGEARRLLAERFAAGEVGARRERIALVGLRGAGKSTLGRLLADARGVPFVELDREVEQASRMELRDIFEVHGQDGFRRLEREALQRVVAGEARAVIATGGGLVADPATFELLLARCVVVWIRAAPEEHMRRVVAQGDQRPMAETGRAMEDLRAILDSREPLYRRADLVLDTAGRTVAESFAALVARLGAPG
jgi:XRE family aerobic/anaerobic benzoate catabolism transcriptional regulator